MNREFKFRAWGKNSREFIRAQNDRKELSLKEVGTLEDLDAWELLQFTGLKDNNDTEIYEGDTVRGWLPDSERDVDFDVAVVKFDEGGFDLYRPNGDYFGDLSTCTLNHSISVIGNIFENLELLRDSEEESIDG